MVGDAMTNRTGRGDMTAIRRVSALLSLAVTLAGCDKASPAEVRTNANEFPVRATWSAALTPVGSSTVTGTLAITEYVGSRLETVINITGAVSNASYQWRIYRGGDCSVNVAATSATSGNGLFLFATTQSYPDLVASGTGAASLEREIAGALDPLGAYSVRIRRTQTSTNWNGLSPVACGTLRPS
jgi:hypothetical protein